MIYYDVIISKSGLKIPLFSDGKPMHSKYDPEKEAETLISGINRSDYFLVLGLGGGYHVKSLLKKYPCASITVLENSKEDADFLIDSIPCTKEIAEKPNVRICYPENLTETILNSFIPAAYSSFETVQNKPWCLFNAQTTSSLSEKISTAMQLISADVSTQSHFGRQWTKNIIQNLKFICNSKKITLPANKTAAVIAAGPTLDKKIDILKKRRNDFYIIATDTANKILRRHKISPDAVFSVDGQFVSINHFLMQQVQSENPSSPLYIFELTANHNAVKKLYKSGSDIIFTISGHPLELLAREISPEAFFTSDSSSGTVTIAAVDFALKTGFTKIEVYGADFSYLAGKTYAAGTYLDDIYSIKQKKTSSQQTAFSALMYRTELIKLSEEKYTTKVLDSYQEAFEKWVKQNDAECFIEDSVYKIKADSRKKRNSFELKKFDYERFLKVLKEKAQNDYSGTTEKLISDPYVKALLPLIAWLKMRNPSEKNFVEWVKLAFSHIVRYTV